MLRYLIQFMLFILHRARHRCTHKPNPRLQFAFAKTKKCFESNGNLIISSIYGNCTQKSEKILFLRETFMHELCSAITVCCV